ncbi:DUF1659 domain-containing protein [Thalassorhabdus alkalitolerans]|uniref:DUF1659 domain-containing protein n=1 Tax=Thalassorhabdus alkalitolerans TaxID=2282697 RepID=A0ABW0YPF4_9BACI|nr:DUF1659 domain-containing protein [Bacillus sp. FJAT-44742]
MNELTLDSRLTIVFETGTDLEGKPTYMSKHFNNIKTDVSNEVLISIVETLAPLQGYTVISSYRVNQYDLAQ